MIHVAMSVSFLLSVKDFVAHATDIFPVALMLFFHMSFMVDESFKGFLTLYTLLAMVWTHTSNMVAECGL